MLEAQLQSSNYGRARLRRCVIDVYVENVSVMAGQSVGM